MVHLRFHPVSMILHQVLIHRGARKNLKTQLPDNSGKQHQINNNKLYRQSNSALVNKVVDAQVVDAQAVDVQAVDVRVEVAAVEGNEFAQRFVVHLFSEIANPNTLIERTN